MSVSGELTVCLCNFRLQNSPYFYLSESHIGLNSNVAAQKGSEMSVKINSGTGDFQAGGENEELYHMYEEYK